MGGEGRAQTSVRSRIWWPSGGGLAEPKVIVRPRSASGHPFGSTPSFGHHRKSSRRAVGKLGNGGECRRFFSAQQNDAAALQPCVRPSPGPATNPQMHRRPDIASTQHQTGGNGFNQTACRSRQTPRRPLDGKSNRLLHGGNRVPASGPRLRSRRPDTTDPARDRMKAEQNQGKPDHDQVPPSLGGPQNLDNRDPRPRGHG